MEPFVVGWKHHAKLPGSWAFFILDGGHLSETVFQAFGFFWIKPVVVEHEFGIWEVFAEELPEVVFILLWAVVFVHREDKFVEAVFGDREQEFVVFFDSNNVLGLIDKFSQETSVLNSSD